MSLLQELVEAFTVLPGVGPKTGQRMALHMLERDREGGARLAAMIAESIDRIGHCSSCQTLSETSLCDICSASGRDGKILCIVENPSDVLAIEHSQTYRGRYFVLRGHLSPLDGIGPDELGIPQLLDKVADGVVQEVIIATGATVEGEATAYYLAERFAKLGIQASRIAHGIPIGGELEYIDGNTLARAFEGRYRL